MYFSEFKVLSTELSVGSELTSIWNFGDIWSGLRTYSAITAISRISMSGMDIPGIQEGFHGDRHGIHYVL
jgi:hypothetical protein